MSTKYEQFLHIFQNKNIHELEPFEDPSFWQALSISEKHDLANLFLIKAESLLNSSEEPFFHSLQLAEEIGKENPEILCKIALILFHYGIFANKKKIFFEALDKLICAQELDDAFIEKEAKWLHLFGNVLIQLAKEIRDESFIEKALTKYLQAERVLGASKLPPAELYWDIGAAWTLLFRFSLEISDLKKALEMFRKAINAGTALPHLRIEYAESLTELARITGDPEPVEEALSLFCGVIADTYLTECEPSAAYKKAWVCYAGAAKLRFELTHQTAHLEEASTIFREAALNVYEQADLWISWGELFLHSGLITGHLNDIETALEKLTSSKIKECDPLKISAFLSQGLVIIGYLLDDLKLLNDGKERVKGGLEIAEGNPLLMFTFALAELYLGLYFSDRELLSSAIALFEKNLEKDSYQIENWYGLYQAYMGLGQLKKDSELIAQGLKAISRLVALRPFSPIYLNEKGISLLRLRECSSDVKRHQEIIEEAVETFKKAWKLSGEEELFFNWGCALYHLGECSGIEDDYLEAIDILSKVYERRATSTQVRYQLAIALSHYGELSGHVESLMQAVELFATLVEKEADNDVFFCDYGYALLNLAELVYDVNHKEKGDELRREAEKKLVKAIELGNKHAYYHLACLYSLCEYTEASLQYLKRASHLNSLPCLEDLEQDDWLECVRKTEEFREFLTMHKNHLK